MKTLGFILFVTVPALFSTQLVRADPPLQRGIATISKPNVSVSRPGVRFAPPTLTQFHPTQIATRPGMNLHRSFATIRPSYRALPSVRAQVRARRMMVAYTNGLQSERASSRSTSFSSSSGSAQEPVAVRDSSRTADPRSRQSGNDRDAYWRAAQRDHHEFHDRDWWHQHFAVIVFANIGYFYLDSGYWYPCWGYDPNSDYSDYNGPVYAYENQAPNQVIADVQSALQQDGYYSGPVTGALDDQTRAALATYQRDNDLPITGNVDESTVESLGLQ